MKNTSFHLYVSHVVMYFFLKDCIIYKNSVNVYYYTFQTMYQMHSALPGVSLLCTISTIIGIKIIILHKLPH